MFILYPHPAQPSKPVFCHHLSKRLPLSELLPPQPSADGRRRCNACSLALAPPKAAFLGIPAILFSRASMRDGRERGEGNIPPPLCALPLAASREAG